MKRQGMAKVTGFLTMTLVIVVPAFAQIPDGVSPGAVDGIAEIEGRCPSFSWGVVPAAENCQLIVYRLPEGMEVGEVDLDLAEEVLYTEVAGQAAVWTPNLTQCLTPGESYAWFVRAVFREEEGEIVEAGEWSTGRFFSISTMPSAREVEEALSVLRRYTGHGPSRASVVQQQEIETEVSIRAGPIASLRRALSPQGQKSVTSAKTAIKGSQSDTTGETYGVVGTSASATGAGLGALNSAGGPDLVLDGVADGATDTLLRESGIYRNSGSIESFTIANSTFGLGGISLQVQGPVVVGGQLSADSAAITNGVTVGTTLGVQGALAANSATITTNLTVGSLTVTGNLFAEGNSWGSCYWTGLFSEEHAPMYCSAGSYVAGMECFEDYCDEVSLYCCKL